MPRCSPRVSGDAEVVWLSSKRKEVAHLIPPLVGTETIKPVARSGLRHGFTLSTTPGITEGVIDNQPFDMELVARRPLKNK